MEYPTELTGDKPGHSAPQKDTVEEDRDPGGVGEGTEKVVLCKGPQDADRLKSDTC